MDSLPKEPKEPQDPKDPKESIPLESIPLDSIPVEKRYKCTLENFIKSFILVILTANILGVKLLPPGIPMIQTIAQITFINLWVYWIHRLTHILPESPLNYHIYSHHDKKFDLPRPLELFCEFLSDMSWFILLIVLQWLFNYQIIPDILIIFFGAWYSSSHVLNLSLLPNLEHKIHHTENDYNFGPPFMDFLFGTFKVEEGYSADSQVINGVILFTLYDGLKSWLESY